MSEVEEKPIKQEEEEKAEDETTVAKVEDGAAVDSLVMLKNLSEYPFYYCRYYTGHTGRAGHEFLEFEIKPLEGGLLKYTNSSSYKKDQMIKKAMCISPAVLAEMCRIIVRSTVLDRDDSNWPEPDRNGRQELEIAIGGHHISFVTSKVNRVGEAEASQDPAGLLAFVYLVQDLKALVLGLVSMHYRIVAV